MLFNPLDRQKKTLFPGEKNIPGQPVCGIFILTSTTLIKKTGIASCDASKKKAMAKSMKVLIVPDEIVMNKIYLIRGKKVMPACR